MKKMLLLFPVIMLMAFAAQEDIYKVDKQASTVQWLAKKTTGQHSGEVALQSGSLTLQKGQPVTGTFELNMNGITVTDIKDADNNASLVEHLKGDDFFAVARNPTALLTISKFTKIEKPEVDEANYTATGELTIKGIKNEIVFPARVDADGNVIKASANITIDRTRWNLTYKSKSILGEMADKFIYDDIAFSVKLVMQKQK